MPILQIPELIRLKDPNLLYKPYYQSSRDNFTLLIGPKVIAITTKTRYEGWSVFSTKFRELFKSASDLSTFSSIKRLGLRYIIFFDFNIYEKTDSKVEIGNETLIKQELLFRTVFNSAGIKSTLMISNPSEMLIDGKKKKGRLSILIHILQQTRLNLKKQKVC